MPGAASASGQRDRAMIVAMVAVRMMQVTADQIVDMVAVRHGLVAAAWAVHMLPVVATAAVAGRATFGIGRADRDHMLVDAVAMRVVQMTILQVIDMAVVLDRGVAAAGSVAVAGLLGVDVFHGASGGTGNVRVTGAARGAGDVLPAVYAGDVGGPIWRQGGPWR